MMQYLDDKHLARLKKLPILIKVAILLTIPIWTAPLLAYIIIALLWDCMFQ